MWANIGDEGTKGGRGGFVEHCCPSAQRAVFVESHACYVMYLGSQTAQGWSSQRAMFLENTMPRMVTEPNLPQTKQPLSAHYSVSWDLRGLSVDYMCLMAGSVKLYYPDSALLDVAFICPCILQAVDRDVLCWLDDRWSGRLILHACYDAFQFYIERVESGEYFNIFLKLQSWKYVKCVLFDKIYDECLTTALLFKVKPSIICVFASCLFADQIQ